MFLSGDTELVRQLYQRLLRAAPAARVQDKFMGPKELVQVRHDAQDSTAWSKVMQLTPAVCVQQQVFRESVVVFHPPHYDAYGE